MKECTKCKGTGLYVGFAEPPGTAVICRTCKGIGGIEGPQTRTWQNSKEYTGRKKYEGIERVFMNVDGWKFVDGKTRDPNEAVSINIFYNQVKAEGYCGDGISGKFRSIDDE
jgi:hypothetical protein